MISAEDEVMIMDFGIARSTGTPTGHAVPGANTIVRTLKSAAANVDASILGPSLALSCTWRPSRPRACTSINEPIFTRSG